MADTPFPAALSIDLGPVVSRLEALLAGQARQETLMSQLSDALKTLTDTATANKAETDQVVEFLHAHAAALNDAVTSGDLAAIQAVNDQLQAETAALAAAIPAQAPTA